MGFRSYTDLKGGGCTRDGNGASGKREGVAAGIGYRGALGGVACIGNIRLPYIIKRSCGAKGYRGVSDGIATVTGHQGEGIKIGDRGSRSNRGIAGVGAVPKDGRARRKANLRVLRIREARGVPIMGEPEIIGLAVRGIGGVSLDRVLYLCELGGTKSEVPGLVQLTVTWVSLGVALAPVTSLGERLSMVTVALPVSLPAGVLVLVMAVTVPVTS